MKFLIWLGVIVAFLAIVGALSLLTAMLSGWVLMILAGAIHHSVWAVIPAFSYWQSVLIAFVLSFIGGLLRGPNVTTSKD